MKLTLTSFLTVFAALAVNAQCFSGYVNIPDPELKNALVNQGKESNDPQTLIDVNNDQEICLEEAQSYFGKIDLKDLSIIDLTGIEAFVNISSLDVSNNNLTNLDLSMNTKLIDLNASNNTLDNLILSDDPNNLLQKINVSNNSLVTFTPPTALKTLYINNNALTSLDLTDNVDLLTVECSGNNLSSIVVDAFTYLNALDCSNNQLTELDFSKVADIASLNVNNNPQFSKLYLNNDFLLIYEGLLYEGVSNDFGCIEVVEFDDEFTSTIYNDEITVGLSCSYEAPDTLEGYKVVFDPETSVSKISWGVVETGEVTAYNVYRVIGTYKELIKTITVSSLRGDVYRSTVSSYEVDVENSSVNDVFEITQIVDGTEVSFGKAKSSLPVELKQFEVKVDNYDAILSWETLTEVNNDYFNVQRSFDGVEFTTISTIKGKGVSSTENVYSYTDLNVGEESSTVYYRLQQVDFDGGTETFNVLIVNFTPISSEIAVYPTIVSAGEKVIVRGNITKVQLLNSMGQSLNQQEVVGNTLRIDTEDLNTGVYFLKVNNKETYKVVVK